MIVGVEQKSSEKEDKVMQPMQIGNRTTAMCWHALSLTFWRVYLKTILITDGNPSGNNKQLVSWALRWKHWFRACSSFSHLFLGWVPAFRGIALVSTLRHHGDHPVMLATSDQHVDRTRRMDRVPENWLPLVPSLNHWWIIGQTISLSIIDHCELWIGHWLTIN